MAASTSGRSSALSPSAASGSSARSSSPRSGARWPRTYDARMPSRRRSAPARCARSNGLRLSISARTATVIPATCSTQPNDQLPASLRRLRRWRCRPATPPGLGPSRLGCLPAVTSRAISAARRLLHWPMELLGIYWLGDARHPPPPAFVIGRTLDDAWIAKLKPDFDSGALVTSIGWDANRVDPLSCTLLIRNHIGGIPALVRHIRVSDLPSHTELSTPEPRSVDWMRRTLDVSLPHAPRSSDWGVALLSPDGRLLDERPVVPRLTKISFSLDAGGAPMEFSIGDRHASPTAADRDEAVRVARDLDRKARARALEPRASTSGSSQGAAAYCTIASG